MRLVYNPLCCNIFSEDKWKLMLQVVMIGSFAHWPPRKIIVEFCVSPTIGKFCDSGGGFKLPSVWQEIENRNPV